MFQYFTQKFRGFTLIELLVVIAIIGILASIVLVSLSGAKTRAKDARIIADMSQVRSEAEILYSSDGNYDRVECTTVCTPSSPSCTCDSDTIDKLCEDVCKQGGSFYVYVSSGKDEYCAYATLQAPSPTEYYCVDYKLTAKQLSSTVCSATVFTCE
ncbi:MAG: type II secretion system protein [Patescibacteria group bacterium]|nr:type II secretion system protein [Patescibacteria group bacterium]